MGNNIKSLHSRLRRLERKTGAGSAKEFYDGLTEEQLFAILELPDDNCDSNEAEAQYFARALNIPIKKAEAFRANLARINAANVREFRHMSDEQLLAELHKPFDAR